MLQFSLRTIGGTSTRQGLANLSNIPGIPAPRGSPLATVVTMIAAACWNEASRKATVDGT